MAITRPSSGFNPRPPITAGESIDRCSRLQRIVVSIRARQLRRANPADSRLPRIRLEFQSAPANYGGRIPCRQVAIPRPHRFNPRPPITAGESPVGSAPPALVNRFNPRPPIAAGESRWRPGRRPRTRRFNPRPPIAAGESCVPPDGPCKRTRFNPRPPIAAGESGGTSPDSP